MEKHTRDRDYVLGRYSSATVRLNLLHNEIKESLGYLLHPSIPNRHADIAICDVGTGTAKWLIDLATELPKANLYGFDLSLDQAPHQAWLPVNVQLSTHDAFAPIPDELVGKFDIVHVQLFMLVVKENDPRPILANLMKLLKPGGFIQWVELDFNTLTFHKAEKDISIDKIVACVEYQRELASKVDARLRPKWVSSLSSVFEEMDLQVVADEVVAYPPSRRPAFTDVTFMTYHEFLTHLPSDMGEKFALLLSEAEEEFAASKRSTGVTMDNRVVVGFKCR